MASDNMPYRGPPPEKNLEFMSSQIDSGET